MINPFKYVQQVRNEVSKIVWPTRKETMTTTIMVFIMSALIALFFFIIDTITSNVLDIILKLSSWFNEPAVVYPSYKNWFVYIKKIISLWNYY